MTSVTMALRASALVIACLLLSVGAQAQSTTGLACVDIDNDRARPGCTRATSTAIDDAIDQDRVRQCSFGGCESGYTSGRWCFGLSGRLSGYCAKNITLWDEQHSAGAFLSCPSTSRWYASNASYCNCPTGATWNEASFACQCPAGQTVIDTADTFACYPLVEIDRTREPLSCQVNPPFGNPIFPLTGTKREYVDLGFSIGWIRAGLTYDTARRAPRASGASPPADTEPPSFGELWSSSLHRRLVSAANNQGARVSRGNGYIVSFGSTPDPQINDRLSAIADGFRLIDATERVLETYDGQGQLVRAGKLDGRTLTFTYSDQTTPTSLAPAPGYLVQVEDGFGRTVQFEYMLPSDGAAAATDGRVSAVVDSTGGRVSFTYGTSGNLSRITWPDGRTREFRYEVAALPWALTGVVDENGARTATFAYDAQGRAIATERANGVDRFSVTYQAPPMALTSDAFSGTGSSTVVLRTRSWQVPVAPVVTQPNGSRSTLGVIAAFGMPRLTSRSQPAGAGCAASANTQSYDANGNVASSDDFNGIRTCYAYDQSRNLERTRVEGLASATACSTVTAAGAALPIEARKTSTQWHPDWRLPTRIAEPGRITTSVYNGQPDPFNANAVASCAPPTATLSDSSPIAVLCKRVEQATTDANGSLGFSASLQTGVANRAWQWTYNANGQVLTGRDPLNNQTTNVYYASTTTDYTLGDLQTSTNAAGHVTEYPRYNKHGQVLRMIDPNGIATDYTYDLRQRLTSVTTAGQTTSYEYGAMGQLIRMTAPDAGYVAYDYDAAHRLIAVSDSRGNRIEYALDTAGNRIAEQVKDPSGALKRQLARSIDALGRVQQTTGRE